MFWKKTGLVCTVLAALAIVGFAQTTTKQRARSATLQAPSGYLGVAVDKIKSLNPKDNSGVVVTLVTPGEPGARAGIHVNDVILEINGQKIDSGEEYMNSIVSKSPGTKVSLLVLRGGVKQTMTATLGLRPPDLPINGSAPQGFMIPAMPIGITPEDLQAMMTGDIPRAMFAGEGLGSGSQLAAYFGVHEGVLVEMVYDKSPAERAGLKAGDVVTKVNGMPVASPREISGVVRQTSKKTVVFTVVRDKKEITLSIEIAWNHNSACGAGDLVAGLHTRSNHYL